MVKGVPSIYFSTIVKAKFLEILWKSFIIHVDQKTRRYCTLTENIIGNNSKNTDIPVMVDFSTFAS